MKTSLRVLLSFLVDLHRLTLPAQKQMMVVQLERFIAFDYANRQRKIE